MKKEPRDYQQVAIDKVVEGFKKADRGQLIMPCGTGKTLISLWIYEKMKAKRTLVLFPSLALLRQTKEEWEDQAKNLPPFLCVCSESYINVKNDEIRVDLNELGSQVTTDPFIIRQFLEQNTKSIIFSTYQSLNKIIDVMKQSDLAFDLALCDEAHKTAGFDKVMFADIHDNSLIPIHKRCYMTATPKIMKKNKNILEKSSLLYCMDDKEIFGEQFHRMPFKEAIERKILVDYEIIVIGVEDNKLHDYINSEDKNMSLEQYINNFALKLFMDSYNAKHIVTFHSTIKKAYLFEQRHHKLFNEKNIYHVNSEQSTSQRNDIMSSFNNCDRAIITNSRCLTEGIDIPNIDAVFFSDPKSSKIDIVQAMGRALRQSKNGKEKGYIVIPLYHKKDEKIDDIINSSKFSHIVSVVRSIADQDERIYERIHEQELRSGNKVDYTNFKNINLSLHGYENDIEIKEKLFTQIIKRSSNFFVSYEKAKEYVHKLSLRTSLEWENYCKSDQKPNFLPYSPPIYYEEFQGWHDWLGESYNGKANLFDFEEAHKIALKLNLKTYLDWRKYCTSPNISPRMPKSPDKFYKNKGWKSWKHWLFGNYLSFDEARNYVKQYKFQSNKEWLEFCKKGKKPNNIPLYPRTYYINKGWTSCADFFENNNISSNKRKYLPYEEAKQFVKTLNIKTSREWQNYRKINRDIPIPVNLYSMYKNSGWISNSEFFDTKMNIKNSHKNLLSYNEAKIIAISLNLNSNKEWVEYYKINRPNNLPRNPAISYKNKGWISWYDFLGKKSNKK